MASAPTLGLRGTRYGETARLDVSNYIAQGMSSSEISEKTGVSLDTVKRWRKTGNALPAPSACPPGHKGGWEL